MFRKGTGSSSKSAGQNAPFLGQVPVMPVPMQMPMQVPQKERSRSRSGGQDKVMQQKLSTSFKYFGGEVQPLAKAVLTDALCRVVDLDPTQTCHLSHKEICKLVFVLCRIKPNTELKECGLLGAKKKSLVSVMGRSRERVVSSEGDGMHGLNDDLSNIDQMAVRYGWEEGWWLLKSQKQSAKAKGRKGGQVAVPGEATAPVPIEAPVHSESSDPCFGYTIVYKDDFCPYLEDATGYSEICGQRGEVVRIQHQANGVFLVYPETRVKLNVNTFRSAVHRLPTRLSIADSVIEHPQLAPTSIASPAIEQPDPQLVVGGVLPQAVEHPDPAEARAVPSPAPEDPSLVEPPQQGPPECKICLSPMRVAESRLAMPCGHTFHAECINKHLETRGLSWETGCPFMCGAASQDDEVRVRVATNRQAAMAKRAARVAAVHTFFAPDTVTEPADVVESEVEQAGGASSSGTALPGAVEELEELVTELEASQAQVAGHV